MAAKQKFEGFRIEDWAIPEDELPWNSAQRQQSRFQARNVVELEHYRHRKRDNLNIQ
jgi:hypothetical protein